MYRVTLFDREFEFTDQAQFSWAEKGKTLIETFVEEKMQNHSLGQSEAILMACLELLYLLLSKSRTFYLYSIRYYRKISKRNRYAIYSLERM